MALTPGTRLGVYEVTERIGAGGMGEVYRARDTQLNREVAIKVLPEAFSQNPDRLARFAREARMLAALNHPHIGAIYGFEDADPSPGFGPVAVRALVLELVEGETLADRLAKLSRLNSQRSGMAVDEALAIARQIASALEAAHEKGIVHRDLKPANIKITPAGIVKVLDFGLAKAAAADADPDVSQSPTMTFGGTREGVILGTAGYMSPEQARGQIVDKRTDIWAFGCVLFELLSGRAVFARDTIADTLAAIVEREPDWQALPAAVLPSVRRLLRRCLDKDAARRLHDIGDARVELDDALDARRASGSSDRAAWGAGAWLVAAACAAGAVGIGLYTWRASSSHESAGTEIGQWVQLTRLSDAVSQPALSSDGRMLTFVRGPETFLARGEIFVKMLPDGEAVQLTHDGAPKMSPVFSPDRSQIAYTTGTLNHWDTWVVPIANGQPRLWLPNASGLVWADAKRILFSEIKNNISHMALVTAEESRAGARDVYVPADERGMAHRSYPSPDGQSALAVEMDRTGAFLPCRIVPMNGGSPGHPVGPPSAGCTSAAWSLDGKWMYLNASAGGAFHIWRQRFPDGRPERVTSGPTEEEGIAMAPDGRSFVTAVGSKQSAMSIHDARGERQVSVEGYGYDPKFTPDGSRLVYRILKGVSPVSDPGELRVLDVASGHNQSLLPGFGVTGGIGRAYDISSDGQRVVAAAADGDGKRRLWLAPLDRRVPPQQIPNVEGEQPVFGAADEIFFRAVEGTSVFAYRVHPDGTGLRKVSDEQIKGLSGISRDSQWLVLRMPGAAGPSLVAFPLGGGSPVRIAAGDAADGYVKWSADGKSLFLSVPSANRISGRTYVIPLMTGQMFPPIPAGGFQSEAAIAKVTGARLIDAFDVMPGLTSDVYAFSRLTMQRNLYRIPIP